MSDAWQRLDGEIVYDARIFRLRKDRYRFRGAETHPYFVLESDPWVNVVPVTSDGQVVLVRQFRHGIREPSLEIPGGLVDGGEAPQAAAARELREETGHVAARWSELGVVSSNPAILTNRTHLFLAEDAERAGAPQPDANEDLTVEMYPVAEIRRMMRDREIHHSLSICALALWLMHDA